MLEGNHVPRTARLPASGLDSPSNNLKNVVFPAPLRPSSPKTDPAGTDKSIRSSTRRPEMLLKRFLASIAIIPSSSNAPLLGML
jgi:hypothetical protein